MKALILAAGYATRLYPLTKDLPKPLIEVSGKPIIEHILENMEGHTEIQEVLIVTNHRFYDMFKVWLNHLTYSKKITLLDDGTLNNDDRLGAVGDINFALKEKEINEDLLVIAGDNLFGFSLKAFLAFFAKKKASVVAFHDLHDKEKVKGRYGVGVLEGSKVMQFQEKPQQPLSTLAATACYVFKKEDLPLVEKSIELGKADNPGDLVRWLVQKSEVHGYVFTEHWFDVGTFESLKDVEEMYAQHMVRVR